MKEIFKEVPGFEGIYEISNKGSVKSLQRIVLCRGNSTRVVKEKIIKPCLGKRGYWAVNLWVKGRQKRFGIHKLIAMAFLKHKPNGSLSVVDHIDNDKNNNNLDNIQVINSRTNCSKDRKNGTSKHIGVSWNTKIGKWVSTIQVNGKSEHLGYFIEELDAANAYQERLKKIIK